MVDGKRLGWFGFVRELAHASEAGLPRRARARLASPTAPPPEAHPFGERRKTAKDRRPRRSLTPRRPNGVPLPAMATKKTKKKTAKVKAKAAPKRAKAAPKKKLRAAPKKKPAAKKAKTAKPKAAVKAKAKPRAKVTAKAKTHSKPKAKTVKRRDATGHLDPHYAAELRKLSHKPDHLKAERAFVGGQDDDLADSLGEQVIESATSGEYDGQDVANQNVPEERGGPFVESSGAREFAQGVDESNPADAKREPFPTT